MAKLATTVSGTNVTVATTNKPAEVEITVSPAGQARPRKPTVVTVQAYLDAGVPMEAILQHALHVASTTVRIALERDRIAAAPK
ncbi:hypothetical protein [Burkholderia glumae]|uniref:Uncharacterized protein n=2 Tax=Burkholderia glumae TaxID=337 RepID=A0ABY5B6L0_BURGL|nr:hypothetical protein [Burkholderia glumae]AJY64609.1 hypothetical protein KS03_3825 [Burkholderia glumae LMG 2196 = ATCC 33617]MCM2484399.1 hypothetical protein [Burkholderia glumae]MCM2494768.1 hypothetical protein [Burkholderia glumae]MCM2510091.1 hypothetical protein [Burkholderia glumae]MCM2539853.1 hypothetical protein [Burkholderia glumae]